MRKLNNAGMLAKLIVATGCAMLVGVSAASGAVVVGQAAPSPNTASTTPPSTFFQATESGLQGIHYRFPSAGVVTGLTIRLGDTVTPGDTVRVDVFRPLGGDNYRLAGASALIPIVGTPGSLFSSATRVSVMAGDLLGITLSVTFGTKGYWQPVGADSTDHVSQKMPPVAVGDAILGGATFSGAYVNAAATVEPDADNDGFGDETQDRCPSDASTVGFCPDRAAPVITQFKTAYKRFRYKPKGLVISRRAHPGTTFSLNLSESAHVSFTVTKLFRGKITKGECKKAGKSNAKNRRCTKTIVVHSFSRSMNTGPSSFPYSARYKDPKARVGTLRPGPYRLTATPVDPAGNVGTTDALAFKIRR